MEKDFIGRNALKRQKDMGVTRKWIGFEMAERGIARAGCKVMKEGRVAT